MTSHDHEHGSDPLTLLFLEDAQDTVRSINHEMLHGFQEDPQHTLMHGFPMAVSTAYSLGIDIGLRIAVADIAAGRMMLAFLERFASSHGNGIDHAELTACVDRYLKVLR